MTARERDLPGTACLWGREGLDCRGAIYFEITGIG
jgi:hypothetical protein